MPFKRLASTIGKVKAMDPQIAAQLDAELPPCPVGKPDPRQLRRGKIKVLKPAPKA